MGGSGTSFNEFGSIANADSGKTYITYITHGSLLQSTEEDMVVLLKATLQFLTKEGNNLFVPSLFFPSATKYLMSLKQFHSKVRLRSNDSVNVAVEQTFEDFLRMEYKAKRNSLGTIGETFYNHITAINFKSHSTAEKVDSLLEGRCNRFIKQLEYSFFGEQQSTNRNDNGKAVPATSGIESRPRRSMGTSGKNKRSEVITLCSDDEDEEARPRKSPRNSKYNRECIQLQKRLNSSKHAHTYPGMLIGSKKNQKILGFF